MIAEQRLQIIHKYLQSVGVNPQDIYAGKKVSIDYKSWCVNGWAFSPV